VFDSSGDIAAAYDFGPFGEDMAATGPAVALNPLRFSSEVWDATLGLVDYTFRPYDPFVGRFISRDPIGERGGLNLYGFFGNDSVNKTDYLGFTDVKGWNKKVLSNAEGHTYGCAEWKCHAEGFSGVANRSSYVRHFEIKSLGAINMDKKLKRTLASELVTGIGVPEEDEETIWAMSFHETALYFTNYKKRMILHVNQDVAITLTC
jgi:RHS repeat-associated protein